MENTEKITIYPSFKIKDVSEERTSLETYLRKKGTDGKWFLWKFYREFPKKAFNEALNIFNAEIYRTIYIGICDERSSKLITGIDGKPIWELDSNQLSEYEMFAHDTQLFPVGMKVEKGNVIPDEEVDKMNVIIMKDATEVQ